MYKKELEVLNKKKRLRERKIFNENIADLASNDYLGLAEKKEILDKAYLHAKKFKAHSAKASMLVNGYTKAHKLFEEYLCELNNFESGIVLGSGFLANMALFELVRKKDLALIDEEYHASGITASKLAQGKVRFFKHNDINDLKEKSSDYKDFERVFVFSEGIFSMAGDKIRKEITDYAQQIGTLIIDEAHSVGICGNKLLGISEEYRLNPDKTIKMGTLGKTLGSYGAYILAKEEIIKFLLNKAKSIIYTTALSPVDTLLAFYAMKYIQENLQFFQEIIQKRKSKYAVDSLIKTIPASSNEEVITKQKELLEKNILIGAIRPPTVKSPIFRMILRICIEERLIDETIEFLEKK